MGEPKLPLGPHQICPVHDGHDVAPPVCEADRPGKQALKQPIRGISALERHAAPSSPTAAQVVADDGRAMRTLLRDEGQYPRDPPGLQRYQPVPRMAAAVERGLAIPPSALRPRRSRRRAGWPRVQQACEPLVMLCRWIAPRAHLLDADTRGEAAPSPVLTFVTTLRPSGREDERVPVGADVEKITMALTPHLCASLPPPWRPPTKPDRDLCLGRLKPSRRHLTGRTNTQDLLRREGRLVALRLGLPPTPPWPDAFAHVTLNDCRPTRHLWRQTEKRSTGWHARHDGAAYGASLEQPWVPHE